MPVDRAARRLLTTVAAFSLLAGCPSDRGEVGSLIEDADARKATLRDKPAGRAEVDAAEGPRVSRYQKREGLHIDMPYWAGRTLAQVDAEVEAEQLGVEISREEVRPGEEHVVYDKAEIWIVDGTIYRIRQELAHPMDTPTALGVSGFPLSAGTPAEGLNLVRWSRTFGMRRIELQRSEQDRRLFTHIDVWKVLPQDLR